MRLTVIRAYLGIVSAIGLLLVARLVHRELGGVYAAVLLVFPGLVPMWVLFSFGAWGDLRAGLVAVALLACAISMVRGLFAGRPATPRQGATIGLLAIACVYLRSSTLLLVLGVGIAVVAAVVFSLRGRDRTRALGALGCGALVFVTALAPWSVFASRALGGRVLTTTSVATVMANTFCQERCR